MKSIVAFLLLVSAVVYSQDKKKEALEFRPDIAMTVLTNTYFGNNYLAKGHKSPSLGVQIKTDWLHYKNFNLGIGFEKSTQKVTDFSIGGTISKTNTNSVIGYFSYDLRKKSKFRVSPELSYGGIELRQKSGSKFYGKQSGKRYGLGVNLNYMVSTYTSFYSNVSYNAYNLNIETTEEYKDYFKNANAISISFGIKFH